MALKCGLNSFSGVALASGIGEDEQQALDQAEKSARKLARQQKNDQVAELGTEKCPASCRRKIIRKKRDEVSSDVKQKELEVVSGKKVLNVPVFVASATDEWEVIAICKAPGAPDPTPPEEPSFDLDCGRNDYDDFVVGLGGGSQKREAEREARRDAIAKYKERLAELRALPCPAACPTKRMRRIREHLGDPTATKLTGKVQQGDSTRDVEYWAAAVELDYEYVIDCIGERGKRG